MTEVQYISIAEHQRLVREAMARASDDEVARMVERDGERMAVLEAELRHVREAQAVAAALAKEERALVQEELKELTKKVQTLTDILTKLSGVKLAFTVLGIVIATAVSQFWHFVSWRN